MQVFKGETPSTWPEETTFIRTDKLLVLAKAREIF